MGARKAFLVLTNLFDLFCINGQWKVGPGVGRS